MIQCDSCFKWFHGRCVGIPPEMAEGIDRYSCPSCSQEVENTRVTETVSRRSDRLKSKN